MATPTPPDGGWDETDRPWDRLTDPDGNYVETAGAYEAFLDYAEMLWSRSIRDLHEEYVRRVDDGDTTEDEPPTTSFNTIKKWCTKYNWVDRSDAYIDWVQWQRKVEQYEKIQNMLDRHANISTMMMGKVLDKLRTIDGRNLSPQDMRLMFKTAAKIERMARGLGAETVDLSVEDRPDRPASAEEVGKDRFEDPEEIAEVFRILAEDAPEAIDDSDEVSE